MPIIFNCPCGKALRVADEHAGRRVKCPVCQAVGNVPPPEPDFEVVEEPQQLAPVPAKGRPVAKSAPRDDDEDDGRGYSVANTNRDEDDEKPRAKKKPNFREGSGRTDDDDEEDERPKKKRKKKRRPARANSDGGKKALYIMGGAVLVCLGIALVAFGVLGDGTRVVKPIVLGICLAISGFGTATQGLTGNFDDE